MIAAVVTLHQRFGPDQFDVDVFLIAMFCPSQVCYRRHLTLEFVSVLCPSLAASETQCCRGGDARQELPAAGPDNFCFFHTTSLQMLE